MILIEDLTIVSQREIAPRIFEMVLKGDGRGYAAWSVYPPQSARPKQASSSSDFHLRD